MFIELTKKKAAYSLYTGKIYINTNEIQTLYELEDGGCNISTTLPMQASIEVEESYKEIKKMISSN